MCGDSDEARRQAALRHEHRIGIARDGLDLSGRADIFGEIEIMGVRVPGDGCNGAGKVVGQRIDHDIGFAQWRCRYVRHRAVQYFFDPCWT